METCEDVNSLSLKTLKILIYIQNWIPLSPIIDLNEAAKEVEECDACNYNIFCYFLLFLMRNCVNC